MRLAEGACGCARYPSLGSGFSHLRYTNAQRPRTDIGSPETPGIDKEEFKITNVLRGSKPSNRSDCDVVSQKKGDVIANDELGTPGNMMMQVVRR